MSDEQNIISTLINQHRTLQKELEAVSNDLKETKPDPVEIDKLLKQFTVDLTEHLKLENEVFYPELLKEMKTKGQDISKTEQFIAEMKEIEKAVLAFLGKYKDADSIAQQLDQFRSELINITETLNLRVESEESGVYSYWGLF